MGINFINKAIYFNYLYSSDKVKISFLKQNVLQPMRFHLSSAPPTQHLKSELISLNAYRNYKAEPTHILCLTGHKRKKRIRASRKINWCYGKEFIILRKKEHSFSETAVT